jgi:hypothetical protein
METKVGDAMKVAAQSECTCYETGFSPKCGEHPASVHSNCGSTRYHGIVQPTCQGGQGCSWCWEKYNARTTIQRLIKFYGLANQGLFKVREQR